MTSFKRVLVAITLVFVVATPASFAWAIWFAPMDTDYTYDIKAQQTFDNSRVTDEDVTAFENLSADEQDLLYRAFKQTDHFMGTSEARITVDDRLEIFNGWRVIEMNGVTFVVAVSGPETDSGVDYERAEWPTLVAIWVSIIGSTWLVGAIFIAMAGPPPSP